VDELKKIIDDYPDFPKKGIIFKDLTPIFANPNVFSKLISNMSSSPIINDADALISIDARGFIFGSAIALHTGKPMILARKPGKLPGELLENDYILEYGKNSLSIQRKSVINFQKFAIVDDLLATGGTALCVCEILSSIDKEVTGISVVVELKELNARSKINTPIDSQLFL
tara:strand:- start:6388 stop:6900 length:513 start_codon:yes stop_codon:yes gene_type:complete